MAAVRKVPNGKGKKLLPSVTPREKVNSVAHLADQTVNNLVHASRHTTALATARSKASRDFNMDHALHHMESARDSASKLAQHIRKNPTVAKEFAQMKKIAPRVSPSTKARKRG